GLVARRLARLAGRPVARVDRILQEVFGAVRAELRDAGEGVDDRVLQLSFHTIHPPDVDVLDRVTVVIEAHGPAGRVRDAHAAQRGQELGAVLGVAAAGLECRAQHAARDVGALRIVGRRALVAGP